MRSAAAKSSALPDIAKPKTEKGQEGLKELFSSSGTRSARTAAPPAAGGDSPAGRPGIDRSFAEVQTVHIESKDAASEKATRMLIELLASQLGIRVDNIRVTVGGSKPRSFGGGVVDHGVVYLDPLIYKPETKAGKYMLAHEVAHVAQTLLPPPSLGAHSVPQEALRSAAEIEAEAVARSFTEQLAAPAVRVPLAADAVAGLSGLTKALKELSAVVKSSHSAEIEEIESLLSYGVFDWAITDKDVEQALFILAMVPMVVARGIAVNIGAKYRARLIDNLSPQHYKAHRTEILAVIWAADAGEDSVPEWDGLEEKILNPLPLRELDEAEATAVAFAVTHSKAVRATLASNPEQEARVREIEAVAGSAETVSKLIESIGKEHAAEVEAVEARKLRAKDFGEFGKTIESLAQTIKDKLDDFVVTDDEALELLDQVVKQLMVSVDPAPSFQLLANEIGNEKLDDFIDQIPPKGLYQWESRRKAFAYLLGTRPAFKNERIAEALMDSPWWKFWDAYTSEEAFVAYLIVKSMPQRARVAFFAAHGGALWSRVLSKLPLNIRQSATFNFYSGGEKDKDRQAVLTQLLDDELWTAASKTRLMGVIRMANAAGEAEFVFEQSKAHRADLVKGLEEVVRDFALYSETAGRTSYIEKPLEGNPFYKEHIFGFFGMLGQALDFIFSSDNVDVDTFALGGEGLNLAEFQDVMGGDFLGAQFARPDKEERKKIDEENEKKKDGEQKKLATNFADLRWDIDSGELKLRADALTLEKLAYPVGEIRLTSGPVHLSGLDLAISYFTPAHALRSLTLSVGHLDLNGVVLGFADSMLSVNRMAIDGLKVTFQAADKKHLSGMGPRSGGSGMALTNLWNVIMGSASPDLSSSLTTPAWAMDMAIEFTSLDLDGLTTSGGAFISNVHLDSFFLHAGGDDPTYKAALRESLARIEARIVKVTPQAESESVPTGGELGPQKKRLARLIRQLEKVKAELAGDHPSGAVMDIAKVSISGLEGVTMGETPLELMDVHGQGRSATAVLPLFSDSTTLRNLLIGDKAIPALKGRRPADDSFSIDFELNSGPLKLVGGIPKPEAARRDYERFIVKAETLQTRPGYAVIRELLATRSDKALRYAELANQGVQHLGANLLQEFKDLRAWLIEFEKARATVIENVRLEGASLVIGSDGQGGFDADLLLIDNIRTFSPDGSPATQIDQIRADKISVSGRLTGGLVNYKEWAKRLEHGEVTADKFQVTGMRNEATGAAIDSLTFESTPDMPGLKASLDRDAGGNTSATLKSGKVTATGLTIPAYAAVLNAELERLAGIPEDELDAGQVKRIAKIREMIADLERIRDEKAAAEKILAGKPLAAERKAAEDRLAITNKDFGAWEKKLRIEKLTIDQLSISVTGLGDVLSDDWDFDQDAKNLAVTGTGKEGHWFEGASVEGVRTGTGPKDDVLIEKASSGPISGGLQRIDNGWALKKFQIPTLTLQGIHYASGATKVTGKGSVTLTATELDANVTTANGATTVVVERLQIASLAAKNLTYQDSSVRVTITSGEFQTINVDGMTVTMPEDPTKKTVVQGTVDVARVKKLALDAAVKGYSVEADISSPAVAAGSKAKAVSVRFGTAGIERVDLLNLSATGSVGQPKTTNKILIEWLNLSASISHTVSADGKDIWDIQRLSVGDFTVAKGSHWEADGTVIDIHDSAKLTKVEASARVVQGKDKYGDSIVESAMIYGLTVDQIEANDVEILMKERKAGVSPEGKKIKPREQMRFRLEKGTINKLKMTGFDLMNRTGKIEVLKDIDIQKLKFTIGDETKKVVQKGTVSFHLHGRESDTAAMAGRELSAELRKDGKTIQIGTMEKLTAEDLEGTVATKLVETGKVTTGPIEITDTKVTIPDLEISSIDVPQKATYDDGDGTYIEVGNAKLTGIHIPLIEAEFNEDGLTRIRLGAKAAGGTTLLIDDITGNAFFYRGKSGGDKTEVRATKVVMKTFTAGNIERDFVSKITKFEGGLQSIQADGFSLLLKETVGKVENTKLLFADVKGTGFRANLGLRDATAGSKKWASELSTFELDELGLTKVRYSQTEDGQTTVVKGQSNEKEMNATVKGLKMHMTPGGGAFVHFDDMSGENIAITLPDGTKAELDLVELHNFALGLTNVPFEKGKKEMAAKLEKLHIKGMWVHMTQQRRMPTEQEAKDRAAASKAAPKWIFEPLGAASADIDIHYQYGYSAHAGVPLRNGSIDFDDVSNPTYGTLVNLGADGAGLYADHPGGRTHYYSPPHNAGVTPETYKDGPDNSVKVDERGSVNLQQMIEGAMNEPSSETPEPPADLSALNDLGVDTKNLKLGGGKLGQGGNYVELETNSDPEDKTNVFSVQAVKVGQLLTVTADLFKAKKGHFEAKGKKGTTGAIQFEKFRVEVGNLGDPAKAVDSGGHPIFEFEVTIKAEDGVVESIEWGDLHIFNAGTTGLAGHPAPPVKGKK